MKVAVLNGAEDISQHFSDEIDREFKTYGQTSQPSMQAKIDTSLFFANTTVN